MRLIRHIALAAGAVALTGCGLNSTNADTTSTATASSPAPATSAPAVQDTPTGTATSPSPDDDATASASTDASATSSAASSTPVTTYSDKTGLLQLPVSNAAIPDAPAGLRDFARTQLKKMWHDQFQDDPGCEGIAQIRIKRTTATAAYVEAGWGATTPTCPQYAGNPGSWAVWGEHDGSWSVTLDGAGLAPCADLVSHAIPRVIYPTCSDGTKKVANPVA
jgi:hypothetical protein